MRIRGALVLVVLLLGACGPKSGEGPEIESPAGEPHYAEAYPEVVEGEVEALEAVDAQVEEAAQAFAAYPDELTEPPWPRVGEIVELADAAGRSRAYVERHDETLAVMRFFVDEEEELKRKVGGSVVYTGKQQGCSDPGVLGGTANRVLERTVDERLEERLHEGNAAHHAIDRYEPELGEKNIEPLRQQVDVITAASFAVYVDAVRLKLNLERRIKEAKDVEKTLERAAEEYDELAQDEDRTDKQKTDAKARAQAARDAQAKIEAAVERAENTLDDVDDRIEAMQDKYDEALKDLIERIEAKQ